MALSVRYICSGEGETRARALSQQRERPKVVLDIVLLHSYSSTCALIARPSPSTWRRTPPGSPAPPTHQFTAPLATRRGENTHGRSLEDDQSTERDTVPDQLSSSNGRTKEDDRSRDEEDVLHDTCTPRQYASLRKEEGRGGERTGEGQNEGTRATDEEDDGDVEE